jgi:hypothetical protein
MDRMIEANVFKKRLYKRGLENKKYPEDRVWIYKS